MLRQKNHAVPTSVGPAVTCSVVMAEAPAVSAPRTPGLVDVPTANTLRDAKLAFYASLLEPIQRTTASFPVNFGGPEFANGWGSYLR